MTKKPTTKLVVRRETIQMLSRIELKRVGAGAAALFDTGYTNCIKVAIAKTDHATCAGC
jgi:hypothetical protein